MYEACGQCVKQRRCGVRRDAYAIRCSERRRTRQQLRQQRSQMRHHVCRLVRHEASKDGDGNSADVKSVLIECGEEQC